MGVHQPGFDHHLTTADGIRAFSSQLYDEGCPVVRSDAHGGFSTLTSYAEVRSAATDWGTFSSAGGITLPKQAIRTPPIEYDPPEHSAWRNLMKEVMTVTAVRAVEGSVRDDTAAIIDRFAPRGEAELVGELAEVQGSPLPPGSEVWLDYAAANRDPEAFDRAEEFVLDRKSKPAPASRWSTGGVAATS